MKLGIIGLPQTGKKSLFELLTGNKVPAELYSSAKPVSGQAEVRDERFRKLVEIYKTRSEVPAKIDIQLFPRLDSATLKDGKIFADIADMDALCHIIRAFRDESVYHVSGSVNPVRDIETVNSELILHDLVFIEKRFEKIKKDSLNKKKDDRTYEHEKKILTLFKEHLEKDLPLRTLDVSQEEEKSVSGYPFISRKKLLIVLNMDEKDITGTVLLDRIVKDYSSHGIDVMQVSAKVESEILMLDSEDEKREFMAEIGIHESALAILSRLAMKTLGLITFFTAGEKEVRQWLIRKSSSAPEAGGTIHSDIQRGFIRAEIIKLEELVEYGSEDNLKKAGKILLMGKDYIINDGDVIYFRFNV